MSIRFLSALIVIGLSARGSANDDTPTAAQQFGKLRPAVRVQPDGLYICEAEEFQPATDPPTAWEAKRFGENYYAATFANCFLSRRAFLGAPEQCRESVASINVDVEEAGRYLVLVRYEAAYRFETQFRLQIEQNGKQVLNRLYGARDNLKIWAFRQKLKKEVGWSWGAVENIVWEGHDVFANLQAGRATIRLIAGKQPAPAARRNVDLVMLTTDVEQVKERIEKENYLPLDGMLTQSGDVWLRVTNLGDQPLKFAGKKAIGGGNWQQHSPYWVHMRNWPAPSIEVDADKTSKWIEVGSTMDSLNHGQWFWTGDQRYKAEFGWRDATGQIQPLAEFTGQGDLALAADGDTRYSRRLRRLEDVLFDLLADLKQANPAPHGRVPTRTPIYARTFDALDEGEHAAAVVEFKGLFGLVDTKPESSGGRGYIDVRSVPTEKLADYCQKLGENAKNIAVVSLGDEIGLPSPRGTNVDEQFRQWLKERGLKPADVRASAGNNWSKINYDVDAKLMAPKPQEESQAGVYYWSKRFQYHFGIQAIKQRTDILRKHLPNAGIGANFSPHYPQEHMFLGEVFKWVTVFRESGMTMPWSEDYIWQVPVGTPQMNNINLDLFRAGLRHHPDRKIMYYVMPHMPNNTPRQWRRLFFGALGHGMKVVDLFEFRPVHVAYTENHVDDPAMYRMVLKSFRELGLFEDIVQTGTVRPAEAALWFSETGDIWGDNRGAFAAGKRSLYTAIRYQQIPLDFVIEEDALDGTLAQYKVLYLTDGHVSTAASKKIAEWVQNGGQLFATAGAGMYNELNEPNTVLRELMGVDQVALSMTDLTWIKQDLPFAEPVAYGTLPINQPVRDRQSSQLDLTANTFVQLPILAVRSKVKLNGAEGVGWIGDQLTNLSVFRNPADGTSPLLAKRDVGKGKSMYCAFLPGLSYYKPAIPKRPVDRGASDQSMIHFLPTDFDQVAANLIAAAVTDVQRPVECNGPLIESTAVAAGSAIRTKRKPLVESTVIESKHGTAIPLINWSGQPVKGLKVTARMKLPKGKVSLASGADIQMERIDGGMTATFDLDAADVIIIRNE